MDSSIRTTILPDHQYTPQDASDIAQPQLPHARRTRPTARTAMPSPAASTTVASPPLYEFSPGCMSDGTISIGHPIVQRYVCHATEVHLAAQDAAHNAKRGPYTGRAWHGIKTQSRSDIAADGKKPDDIMSWWPVHFGGVTSPATVGEVLGAPELKAETAEAVFALAALCVFNCTGKSAHWAFWGWNQREETLRTVFRVLGESLCDTFSRPPYPPSTTLH